MNEERIRILKMIENGQISAEEGARLIEALESPEDAEGSTRVQTSETGAESVRVRVFDGVTGREKVNVAIPLRFARMMSSLIPEAQRSQLEEHGIRLEDIMNAIESGKVGKVVDIENKELDEKIELSIE